MATSLVVLGLLSLVVRTVIHVGHRVIQTRTSARRIRFGHVGRCGRLRERQIVIVIVIAIAVVVMVMMIVMVR